MKQFFYFQFRKVLRLQDSGKNTKNDVFMLGHKRVILFVF